MKRKSRATWKKNKSEIIWHIINSMLAGTLVLLGSFTSAGVTKEGIITALIISLITIVTRYNDYWNREEKEYSVKVFSFIH